MNLPNIQPNNVQSFLNKEEIVRDTAEQIMKDFGMFGVEISFSGNIDKAYEELFDQLVGQVEYLLSNQSERLMSILYQVDIHNRDIQRTQNEFPNYTLVEVVSHQIIFRDLKKVMLRRYFKSKKE